MCIDRLVFLYTVSYQMKMILDLFGNLNLAKLVKTGIA